MMSRSYRWFDIRKLLVCDHSDGTVGLLSGDNTVDDFSIKLEPRHLPALRDAVAKLERVASQQARKRAETVKVNMDDPDMRKHIEMNDWVGGEAP